MLKKCRKASALRSPKRVSHTLPGSHLVMTGCSDAAPKGNKIQGSQSLRGLISGRDPGPRQAAARRQPWLVARRVKLRLLLGCKAAAQQGQAAGPAKRALEWQALLWREATLSNGAPGRSEHAAPGGAALHAASRSQG